MCEMYDKLMADMKSAMKAKDMMAVNTIRGIIAKAKDLTVNAGKEMTDDAVLGVIAKGVKQRDESIAQFEAAGRAELAEGEKAERAFLQKYLPAQLSEAEVSAIVKAVTNWQDAKLIAKLSENLGEAMVGINADEIQTIMEERGK